MSDFYDRKLRLIFGDGIDAVEFNGDLKVTITVTKDILKSEPDSAMVTVYNLNNSSRTNLTEKYKGCYIYAGYGKEIELFKGEIQAVEHVKNGVDWVTSIICGDGAKALQQAYMSKTYSAGTTVRQMINDISGALGSESEIISGGYDKSILQRGKTIDISAKEAMDQLAANNNFDWSIQSDKIVVVPHDKARQDEIYVISSKTGMIGSPEFIDIGVQSKSKKAKEKNGIKFSTFLIPFFQPGKLVKVESDTLKGRIGSQTFVKNGVPKVVGTYKITRVEHNLETLSGGFTSTVEAEVYSG